MAKGFKHGSGGSSLNFKVVPYATEDELKSATPIENTIGVITDKNITGYYFATTQPDNMAEGEIWIITDKSSLVAFDVLKKDSVMVYPVSAKQMVSGALVNVTAKSYQNGEWNDWLYYIVNGSDSRITNIPQYASSQWTISDNGLTLTRNSGSQNSLGTTEDTFDLTGKTKFVLELTNTNRELWVGFCSATSNTSLATLKMTTGGTYTLDVSSINQVCRIRFDLEGSSSATIRKMYLE